MPKASNGPTSLISLGSCRASRFCVGHNPLCGNSHLSAEMNAEMTQYFTAENVVKLYQRAEALGVRTIVIRGDYRMLHWLELYRRAGGKMNIISQTASEMHDIYSNIRVLAAAGVAAIYHHGTQTDKFWREGRINDCLPYLRCMRDCGVAVGLATHIPEVIAYAQEHDWDVDFYLGSLYNLSRVARESAIATNDASSYGTEVYLQEDREKMLAMIQATSKPVLAFKILAASRLCSSQESVREAICNAYASIKPIDGVIVGLFPKHLDQVQADLEYANDACRVAPLAKHATTK